MTSVFFKAQNIIQEAFLVALEVSPPCSRAGFHVSGAQQREEGRHGEATTSLLSPGARALSHTSSIKMTTSTHHCQQSSQQRQGLGSWGVVSLGELPQGWEGLYRAHVKRPVPQVLPRPIQRPGLGPGTQLLPEMLWTEKGQKH
jgi:hypothetical protein